LLGPTLFESLPQAVITALVLMVAEAFAVLFGFGAGLIAVGSLAMVLSEVQDVVVLLVCLIVPVEVYVVATSWRVISWRGVALICVGIAVGVPLGTLTLQVVNASIILVALGGFLVFSGLAFLFMPQGMRVRWPVWAGPLCGVFAGVLGGMFSTGGPPLIFYYRLAGVEKGAFRGNLMAIFLMMSIVRVPSYVVAGLLTAERLWTAALLMPVVLLGAWLGNKVHIRLSEQTFQRLVACVLCLLGVLLLFR